jgi:hypothetical protein
LKALRPDLESGKIHVYSFSKHNHPLECDGNWLILVFPKFMLPKFVHWNMEGIWDGNPINKMPFLVPLNSLELESYFNAK